MARPVQPLLLDEAELLTLQCAQLHHPDWRARQRALTLLLLAQGHSCLHVAQQMNLGRDTVGTTRAAWREHGLVGLRDLPRCGAPRKLDAPAHERLAQWAGDAPHSTRELLELHQASGGVPVRPGTVRQALRRQALVFKRTRHSLKKNVTLLTSSAPAAR